MKSDLQKLDLSSLYRLFVDDSNNVTFNVQLNMNNNERVLKSMGFDCVTVKKHHGGSSLLCWLCPKGTYGAGDSSAGQLGCSLCPAGMVVCSYVHTVNMNCQGI